MTCVTPTSDIARMRVDYVGRPFNSLEFEQQAHVRQLVREGWLRFDRPSGVTLVIAGPRLTEEERQHERWRSEGIFSERAE